MGPISSLEEGQLPEVQPRELVDDFTVYNPAYEWPAESHSDTSEINATVNDAGSEFERSSDVQMPSLSSSSSNSLKPGHPIFRLVVERSFVIKNSSSNLYKKRQKQKEQKLAVALIDSLYHQVEIGRDVQPAGSVVPRVRLKEMDVSKLHATIFWDGAKKEWNVVDMGSKHGSFLLQAQSSDSTRLETDFTDSLTESEKGRGTHTHSAIGMRLSKPRAASVPWRLRHTDRLTIGSTTFVVHLHDNQRPCQVCGGEGREELVLFPTTRTRDVVGAETTTEVLNPVLESRDPKKTLSMLKRSLLTRHSAGSNSSGTSKEYVDRAARRRMMYPPSRSDSPGVAALVNSIIPSISTTPEPVSQPPTPLSSSNVGHRLLMQQGWNPGTALGLDEDNIVEPIEVKTTQNRAGLGVKLDDKFTRFNR